MSGSDDRLKAVVPRAEDIFLRRKPKPRTAAMLMPGLFDAPAAPSAPAADTAAAQVSDTGAARDEAADVGLAAKVWSVGELVGSVRSMVESRYAHVSVEGEISNWRPAASGHCYFTLKDGVAQLAVVMFRREASLIRFKPKDGDAVQLRGQVSLYEARGQMQLIAERMELAGVGAQLAAVQELKTRLKREGLFENKRALPAFPKCIGVVTSLQGAALRDIVKVCRRRHAAVNLLVYPAAVQGPQCAGEIAAGVRWFSGRLPDGPGAVDVVIVARGGGSWEDLHGFDDERVVRAIAACTVPVVVGVGHATDTVLADAAADVCAPTPSAAAELVTAAQHMVEEKVLRMEARLRRAGRYELLRLRQRLAGVNAEAVLRRVRERVGRRAQRVDEMDFRLQAAGARTLRRVDERVSQMRARLARQNVSALVARDRRRLEAASSALRAAGRGVTRERAQALSRAEARVVAMSPLRVLERGYALVYAESGKLLRAAEDARVGETLTARLARGSVRSVVTKAE